MRPTPSSSCTANGGYPSIFVDTGPSAVRSVPAKEQFHSSVLKLDSWIPQNYLPPAQRAPTQRAAFSHCHRHSGSNAAKRLLAQPHTWKPAKWSCASRASFLPAGAPTHPSPHQTQQYSLSFPSSSIPFLVTQHLLQSSASGTSSIYSSTSQRLECSTSAALRLFNIFN
jgi:hypothetical protein